MLTAITRPTGPELARCELTHVRREPIDTDRACAQHRGYVEALSGLGVRVIELARLPDHPDAVFVEDAAIVLDELAVVLRPGAASRLKEIESVAEALAEWREVERLEEPSTMDGGDLVVAGRTVFVGLGDRTSIAGLAELSRTLLPHGYRMRALEVAGCLHLKTACCAVDDETLLVNRAWLEEDRLGRIATIDVPAEEPLGANVVRVGETLLVSASAPRTAELLESRGFAVRPVDVSEFAKAEGALTCKSLIFPG